MATKFDPTKLDFDSIKAGLKTKFEESGHFNDYDFEGSGLSTLLDVLAYNTHLNALVANFSTNEAFLDTAQLRSSVVSHAKPLNYLPRSRRSATAVVTLTLQNVTGTTDITIPKYTRFTTSIDSVVYTFYTLDEYIATSANSWTVTATIYEGKLMTKRFIVDTYVEGDYPIYVIPDANVDTSTMTVLVKDGLNSTSSDTYTVPSNIGELTSVFNNYFIYESPNGYYEIIMGDGLVGNKPEPGSVIDVTYLKSKAAEANNAKSFATSDTVGGYTISVSLVTKATGGAERENIESIRFNAPKAFAAQNRAVTEDDYKVFLQQELSYVESLNVWGGEKNVPPVYGNVFICVKPTDAVTLTDERKTQILTNVLGNKNIVTIRPQFVDAEFQYIEVRTNIRYEPRKTILSKSQIESKIKDSILQYGTDNLSGFDSIFRRSRLESYLDDSDDSVVSVDATIFLQRRLIPTTGVRAAYNIPFTIPLAAVTDYTTVVTSDNFTYTQSGTAYVCSIRNKLNSTTLEIIRTGDNGVVVVEENAGYIDTTSNKLVLSGFNPTSIPNSTEGIRFTARPSDENTIYPKRNLLIAIDPTNTAVSAAEDLIEYD